MARLLRAAKRRNAKALRFQFELSIDELTMSVPIESSMSVSWSRGHRTATSETVSGKAGVYRFEKPLKLIATVYQDLKDQTFQSKSSRVLVRQRDRHGGMKVIGMFDLDLAELATHVDKGVTSLHALQKCSDKKAKVRVHTRGRWLKELAGSQVM